MVEKLDSLDTELESMNDEQLLDYIDDGEIAETEKLFKREKTSNKSSSLQALNCFISFLNLFILLSLIIYVSNIFAMNSKEIYDDISLIKELIYTFYSFKNKTLNFMNRTDIYLDNLDSCVRPLCH